MCHAGNAYLRVTKTSHLEPSHTLPHVSLLLFVLNCILIINVAFPLILWIDLVNYEAWWSSQEPLFSRQLVRSEGGPRDPELVTGIYRVVRATWWMTVPLTVKFGLIPGSLSSSTESSSVLFSSAQSLSNVRLFATPWIAAHQASLSITNSRSLLKFMSIESVMPYSHIILCCSLLLLPPIPPSIRVMKKIIFTIQWESCFFNCYWVQAHSTWHMTDQ